MLALLEAVAPQHLDHLAALVEGAHEGDHYPQVVQAHLVAHLAHGLALDCERVCERRINIAAWAAAAADRVLIVRSGVPAAEESGVIISEERRGGKECVQ